MEASLDWFSSSRTKLFLRLMIADELRPNGLAVVEAANADEARVDRFCRRCSAARGPGYVQLERSETHH
jgi:hypothetical protein